MKKENLKKETVKAILYICLLFTGSFLAIMITDNGILLFLLGMIFGSIYKLLEKWIDEEDK